MMIDHWKALFDQKYLRWFDLKGQPSLCEIVGVHPRVELTLPGGVKTRKPIIQLKQVQGSVDNDTDEDGNQLPTIKPLVLNSTNGGAIAEIHGPKPSQWKGKQIVLFEDRTKMWSKEHKKMIEIECIRIRAPKQQKEQK